MSFYDAFLLLVLNALFIGLLSVGLFLKAHGAIDSDLSALHNITGAMGAGILSYIGWIFVKLYKNNGGGPPKP